MSNEKAKEVEQEDINDVDKNDGEDINFNDEENNKKMKDAIELINCAEYPTENERFLEDLMIVRPNVEGDDEIIRKIIDKGLDFALFYDPDTDTAFRATRPLDKEGKELVAVSLLAGYLKNLKDLVELDNDIESGVIQKDKSSKELSNNLRKTLFKYKVKLEKFTKGNKLLGKFLAHANQKQEDDKEEDKEEDKKEEVNIKDPDWRKKEFRELYDKDSKICQNLNRHIGIMKGTIAQQLRSFLSSSSDQIKDLRSKIIEAECKLRNKDFEIYGYIEVFCENEDAINEFKKDNNCLIHYVNKDDLKDARDKNLESKKKIDTKTNNQRQIIKEKNEKLEKNQKEIEKLKERVEKQRNEQFEIWQEIMEMESKDFDIDKISDPDEFGSSIIATDQRYNEELIKSLLKEAGIPDQMHPVDKFLSNDSMDKQYKKGGSDDQDNYCMTFYLDDIRWAYVLKRFAKSKGLKKNITEYVFEHINDKKMQDSIHTDMKQNIDEIKNEKFFEINIQDILIEMLTTLKKTPNFHIKSLTIKGDEDLREIGGIDNESFRILLDELVSSRLCILSLWGIDIDEDKSNIISEALSKRRAGKSKKTADLEIKIAKCNIKDDFGFLSNIADGTQVISSISITHCGLTDASMVALLRALVKVKGLDYVNLSSNQLKEGCLDAFKAPGCLFQDSGRPVRFNLASNKLGTSNDDKNAQKGKLVGVENVIIS